MTLLASQGDQPDNQFIRNGLMHQIGSVSQTVTVRLSLSDCQTQTRQRTLDPVPTLMEPPCRSQFEGILAVKSHKVGPGSGKSEVSPRKCLRRASQQYCKPSGRLSVTPSGRMYPVPQGVIFAAPVLTRGSRSSSDPGVGLAVATVQSLSPSVWMWGSRVQYGWEPMSAGGYVIQSLVAKC